MYGGGGGIYHWLKNSILHDEPSTFARYFIRSKNAALSVNMNTVAYVYHDTGTCSAFMGSGFSLSLIPGPPLCRSTSSPSCKLGLSIHYCIFIADVCREFFRAQGKHFRFAVTNIDLSVLTDLLSHLM